MNARASLTPVSTNLIVELLFIIEIEQIARTTSHCLIVVLSRFVSVCALVLSGDILAVICFYLQRGPHGRGQR